MVSPAPARQSVSFGAFEVDLRTPELRRNGDRIKLQEQPFQVLSMLLEHPGDLVTREELRQRLWSAETFVDFDVGLNTAIMKLRDALGDSAEHPTYIETIPRRGYRFIYPVNGVAAQTHAAAAATWWRRPWVVTLGLIVVASLFAGLLAFNVAGMRDRLSGKPPVPPISSLAVLPLENLTGDPEQEYLVDGIHDELVTQVAQISSLKVISRTSVLRYKQTKLPLREIARELGVDGIVEGAVQRNGDRLHISAQLIYAPNDRHLWARSYDRALAEIPTLPSEIAAGLAHDLGISLTPQERSRLAGAKAVDPEAYKLFLKGKYYERKWTNENLKKAIEFYRQALDLDPNYSHAWTRMGLAYEGLAVWAKGKDLSPDDARRRAKAAVERAVALDPDFRGAHQVLGQIKAREGDFDGAAREFEVARRLDPKWLGPSTYLTATARYDEAVAATRDNAERDPFSYSVQLVHGFTLWQASRFDESIAQLKKAAELEPEIHHAHYELAWNYAKKRMYADGVRECDTANDLLRQKHPDQFVDDCGWVYALGGRRKQALEIAHRLEHSLQSSDDEYRFGTLARIYDALGDRDRALGFLKMDLRHPYSDAEMDKGPSFSDELKADPRFQELARQVRGYPPPFGALIEVRGSAPPTAPSQSAR